MSETWVWNNVVYGDLSQTTINFIAGGNLYNHISVKVSFAHGDSVTTIYYDDKVAYESLPGIYNTWYLDKTMTFLESPTGSLLTYLQANATKQETSAIGLKNLSSYNQDLSIPRKKDLYAKQDIITGGASTITTSNLNARRALISDANGKVSVSSVTSTELGYLDGVTSNVQTQLNNIEPRTLPSVNANNNLDVPMVVNGAWQTDHGYAGIQNASSLIVNKWPNNVTVVLKTFRRWGKLCLFTIQFNVGTQILSDYGFTLFEMPYTSIDRVWINNQTLFFMDADNVAVRVNNEQLATGNYILTGFYLTIDNAKVI